MISNTYFASAQVWAYLCLVAIRTQREIEAQQCFKFMNRLGLRNTMLQRDIEVSVK
jgi:hypothetical protein